ncbi:hypothetical protein [Cognatishimia sp. MH4019]|uniref:hypothetical protein n=1 Tax=Cognatishimia sp. MH4019 TaxID=2854030 RepID=UPI001CD60C92|nr:hypothetical protein [Cognatishimia sp. MH4019]
MSVADFRIEPAAGPYVLGPDGRLQPLDRKKDLRARIRAVLRNQGIVADVARGLEARAEMAAPLWAHAVDMQDDAEVETQVA